MFERYTERARRVLFFGRYEASQMGSRVIDTEHLLLGLLREGKGLTSSLFAAARIGYDEMRREIEGRVGLAETFPTHVEIPFSPLAKRVLHATAEEADRLLHTYIGTEHLLLGLLRVEEGLAASILTERGMRLDAARDGIVQLLNRRSVSAASGPGDSPTGAPPDLPPFLPSDVLHVMRSQRPPSIRRTPDAWIALGCTLRRAIAVAWGVDERRVEVPGNLADARFDFVLLVAPRQGAELDVLVRRGIEEQFGLTVTAEHRPTEVFIATVAAGAGGVRQVGPSAGGSGAGAVGFVYATAELPGNLTAGAFPMDGFSLSGVPAHLLCQSLEDVLGRPVIDGTGLTGVFDVSLTGRFASPVAFIQALAEQAGLVLRSAQRDVELLVARPRDRGEQAGRT